MNQNLIYVLRCINIIRLLFVISNTKIRSRLRQGGHCNRPSPFTGLPSIPPAGIGRLTFLFCLVSDIKSRSVTSTQLRNATPEIIPIARWIQSIAGCPVVKTRKNRIAADASPMSSICPRRSGSRKWTTLGIVEWINHRTRLAKRIPPRKPCVRKNIALDPE